MITDADLQADKFVSLPFQDVIEGEPDFPLDLYLTRTAQEFPLITFDRLLRETPVARDLRRMLEILEEVYEHPVDIEFTLNFLGDGSYRIHLLQCRTFQIRRDTGVTPLPAPTTHTTLLAATAR